MTQNKTAKLPDAGMVAENKRVWRFFGISFQRVFIVPQTACLEPPFWLVGLALAYRQPLCQWPHPTIIPFCVLSWDAQGYYCILTGSMVCCWAADMPPSPPDVQIPDKRPDQDIKNHCAMITHALQEGKYLEAPNHKTHRCLYSISLFATFYASIRLPSLSRTVRDFHQVKIRRPRRCVKDLSRTCSFASIIIMIWSHCSFQVLSWQRRSAHTIP